MTFDDISKICSDFYREDEIVTARSLLERSLPHRLPKRQGGNKCRGTVEDLLKACLDPAVSLPVYYAVNLNRIPPVDANHCDISAVLAEIQYLRAEVRNEVHLSDEVAVLRRELSQLKQMVVDRHDFERGLDEQQYRL